MDVLGPRRYEWPVGSLAFTRQFADRALAGPDPRVWRGAGQTAFLPTVGVTGPGWDSCAACSTVKGGWFAQSAEILAFR
jgi:hypothetical protein